MRRDVLFREVAGLVRPGGGIAVVTNGTPLWLQETGWSRALREFLEGWLDTALTATCGTDEAIASTSASTSRCWPGCVVPVATEPYLSSDGRVVVVDVDIVAAEAAGTRPGSWR
jgi:hypothetical protein